MSRIGKIPVSLPESVKVTLEGENGNLIKVTGPMGSVSDEFKGVKCTIENDKLIVSQSSCGNKPMWGTARNKISDMITGVCKGFSNELVLNGVGIKALLKGEYIVLSLGKSHDFFVEIPKDTQAKVPSATSIVISGINKERVSKFSSLIKSLMPIEPYKGKGIKSKDEIEYRKEVRKS